MRTRLLLVEDDRVDQMAFRRFCDKGQLAYECVIVSSVKEAREALKKRTFDVAVIDYLLGDGTAFDLFSDMNQIPFIIVTGEGSESVAVEAIKAGAADYLIKEPNMSYLNVLPAVVSRAASHYKAQQKLHLLSEAMANINDSVFITQLDGRVIYVNDAFCRTYGYDEKEMIGQSASLLEAPAEGRGAVGDALHKKHRRKNGDIFPVALSVSSMRDRQGTPSATIHVVHDISEHKRMEQALLEAIQKYASLLELLESKNEALEQTKKRLEHKLQSTRGA